MLRKYLNGKIATQYDRGKQENKREFKYYNRKENFYDNMYKIILCIIEKEISMWSGKFWFEIYYYFLELEFRLYIEMKK